MVKNLPAVQEMRVQSPSQEDPMEKEMATHSRILAWRSHAQRSLVGYSLWDCQESNMNEVIEHACMHILTLSLIKSLGCIELK